MTDYTKGTGSGGIMLIRDQGYSVEFHIQAGLSATFVGTPGFATSAYIDGSWHPLANVSNYSNRTWRYLGAYNVGSSQNICFHIDYSGTQGFGGPTDFWQAINRGVPPAAPTALGIDQVLHTEFRYRFSGNGDGGTPIREWQIAYGYDPNTAQFSMASNGTSTITGLDIGRTVYVWSRGRNDAGWGAWSARLNQRTLASARVRVAGHWRDIVLHVKVAGVWRQTILYTKVAGTWRLMSGADI